MALNLQHARFVGVLKTSFSLKASNLLDQDYWMVDQTFYFYLNNETSVEVPKGYLTDGASVPRLLWAFIPPWGAYGQAAVLHDYLCEYLTVTTERNDVKISRKECDAILNHAMLLVGVPWFKRWLIYLAVCFYRIVFCVSNPNPNPHKQELELALMQEDSGDPT